MIKSYDPQYETNVPHFNRKIVGQWVEQNELEKIKHWLENGRPHERLATDAVYTSIYQDNAEIINTVYMADWISKEKILDLVLNKCTTSIFPKEYGKDYFPNVRKWVVAKIFEEISNGALKEKLIKQFMFSISMTMSCDEAYKYGIDYTIKNAEEYLDMLIRDIDNELYKLGKNNAKDMLEDKNKIVSSIKSSFEKSIFFIKNNTPVNDNIFRLFFMYSALEGYQFIKPFLLEILSLNIINIANNRQLGLFVTEMSLWKHCQSIEESIFSDTLKLFIRSGLKEKISIKRKEVMGQDGNSKEGCFYDYFKARHGVVGTIQRKNSIRQNLRENQVLFYKNYSLPDGDEKEKITIDIREYLFINHSITKGFDNKLPVSKEEISESVDMFEKIKRE